MIVESEVTPRRIHYQISKFMRLDDSHITVVDFLQKTSQPDKNLNLHETPFIFHTCLLIFPKPDPTERGFKLVRFSVRFNIHEINELTAGLPYLRLPEILTTINDDEALFNTRHCLKHDLPIGCILFAGEPRKPNVRVAFIKGLETRAYLEKLITAAKDNIGSQ